jgi:nitrate/nitrite transporter NarK
VASAFLYVFFGWLSDRVGRKPVMLGGMMLMLVAVSSRLSPDDPGRQSGPGPGPGRSPR